MNVSGPNQVPCGMPPFKVIQYENVSFIFTLCLRSLRTENIEILNAEEPKSNLP